ncbi:MAG: bifunctional UDP-N-acetylglucosamine diphosphorylase/glucosamine-1-phosphate N-acetyltransferase GlmU [Gammaproteobacteria bacterium]|nr:bifunctional UDP-N-acetylglucosamine diphosphorylase/glucosamine-1-phosphate N-acetyltransferase GlmU [Gammaproteobacteria bacterium]MCI0590155.1 bifunctional UDP-N-acetylglucosamine diphosphorylase/glucosamine-1-phosphate N-acetyltransferase GlmU [Gammaproteobacteria bacterium]
MSLSIVILAAGQGVRMRSESPKVLHRIAGMSLLEHVFNAACDLPHREIYVIYGYGGRRVPEELERLPVKWVEQAEQLGTGHAVAQVLPSISSRDTVLVLYGDVPLITASTLKRLLKVANNGELGLLTVELENPTGYGRIVRNDNGTVVRIVEETDASDAERVIREVNTGIMAVSAKRLKHWVETLDNDNVQGEYYLTDVPEAAVRDGVRLNTVLPDSVYEVMGVNDRAQLAELERYYQLVQAQHLMNEGVTLADPVRFDLRGDLEVGQDVFIDVNVVIEGTVQLGNRVSIGPNTYIRDAVIADGVTILSNCVIEDAVIGKDSRVGPFSRIRPESRLDENVHVGNFVEIKKSNVGRGTKINHLSYIGDSDVGKDVNIGAGTITCNYDGAYKHRTVIGDNVFIGSDTQLVAPVKVGNGATIGAGSTITSDAPSNMLTLSRAEQKTAPGWKRPEKKK